MSAKSISWRVKLGAALLTTALALFGLHYLAFRDFHHLAVFTVHDIAFLPVEVLIVTMILHELLERRARREKLLKLNMVIGAFFSEVGAELLRRIARFEAGGDAGTSSSGAFIVRGDWDARRYAAARAAAAAAPWAVDAARGDLGSLRAFLLAKRDFLLRLLENPNLLEHESFTDALWAVFHLTEELEHRPDVTRLSRSDLAHLSGDMRRACSALAVQWLGHLQHLKESYPYLFSLAVRRNPLDPDARVEIAD
jgi:hypothetical protein